LKRRISDTTQFRERYVNRILRKTVVA
jgi:hypothetical protein